MSIYAALPNDGGVTNMCGIANSRGHMGQGGMMGARWNSQNK